MALVAQRLVLPLQWPAYQAQTSPLQSHEAATCCYCSVSKIQIRSLSLSLSLQLPSTASDTKSSWKWLLQSFVELIKLLFRKDILALWIKSTQSLIDRVQIQPIYLVVRLEVFIVLDSFSIGSMGSRSLRSSSKVSIHLSQVMFFYLGLRFARSMLHWQCSGKELACIIEPAEEFYATSMSRAFTMRHFIFLTTYTPFISNKKNDYDFIVYYST